MSGEGQDDQTAMEPTYCALLSLDAIIGEPTNNEQRRYHSVGLMIFWDPFFQMIHRKMRKTILIFKHIHSISLHSTCTLHM
jgi:hypothetical protein